MSLSVHVNKISSGMKGRTRQVLERIPGVDECNYMGDYFTVPFSSCDQRYSDGSNVDRRVIHLRRHLRSDIPTAQPLAVEP